MTSEIAQRTAANRRFLADFFEGLDDAQLGTPSLCGAWSVRQVVGHLVTPLAERPTRDLTAILRDRADVTVPAPGGSMPTSR